MIKRITALLLFCSIFLAAGAQTADYNVVPLPQDVKLENGASFELNSTTLIAYSGGKEMKRNAQLLAGYIKESIGLDLKIVKSKKAKSNAINLLLGNSVENPKRRQGVRRDCIGNACRNILRNADTAQVIAGCCR